MVPDLGPAKALIKPFETFRARAYICPAGYPTQGYGRVIASMNVPDITLQQAGEWLEEDLNKRVPKIIKLIKVPVTNNQFCAIVSFVYNVGLGAFKASTLLRKLNRGDIQEASNEFLKWNKGGGRVLKGLTRRRIAERALFLS